MAFVIVPSLPVNVSVPVHCDVGNLFAAVAVGAKTISCVTNTRDRSKRTFSAFIVFLAFPPHFLDTFSCPQFTAICWGGVNAYLFIDCRIVERSEFYVCDKVTEPR